MMGIDLARMALLLVGSAACNAVPEPAHTNGVGVLDGGAVFAALPFRDLAGDPELVSGLLGSVRADLEGRGARFVPEDEVEAFLRARRIRYTESISVEDARAIGEATGARFLLLGSTLASERSPVPRIAVALRVVDARTGGRMQSQLVALRGDEFAGLLGIGAIEDHGELALEVAERLLDRFDGEGHPLPPGRRGASPGWGEGTLLSTFVDGAFDPGSVERIAVLPFHDRTEGADAGLLFAELLSHRWFASAGVEVIEQSELRAAMRRERVRSVDGLDLAVLREVGRGLDTRYFVLGSVDRFQDQVFVEGARLPELEVTMRVVDVEQGRAVAATGVRTRGDDYHVLLGLGTVSDPIALADRAAREMIAAVGDWRMP